ncbi:ABC transporter permease [Polyangium spumosum]|uniref:ABC transporter permease subunit n=1 Tax=Polyangium spumosum TaxID=889282 RepID=A0A6N7PF47_9BACT|nr:ABC transporter permease [Polyangium spumosum]MRG90638.1 ABC transporter permease subunit [Polyangium spumosum]
MRKNLARVAQRVGWALVVVYGVTLVSFALVHVLPGDPVRLLVGPQASARDVARAREVYGHGGPLGVQYLRFLRRLVHTGAGPTAEARKDLEHRSCAALGPVHFDLGHSFHYRRPVVDLVAAKLPRSLELALAALLVQLTVGLGLGITTAARRGTRWDELGAGLSLLGISAPTFLTGLALQYLLAHRLGLLPYDGIGKTPGEHLRSLVLPALTLGIYGSALYARLVRAELGAALAEDHVRMALAKGASRARALVVHGLRTALVPVTTLAVLDLGALVGGAVVTERLFRWPGMGQMAVESLLNRDGPVIVATVLVASIAVVLSTLLVDLLAPLLDPRIDRDTKNGG